MSTLSTCIRRAGKALNQSDAAAIRALRDELRADGLDPQQAAIEAVVGHIQSLLDEHAAITTNPDYRPILAAYDAHTAPVVEAPKEPAPKPATKAQAKLDDIDAEIEAAAAELAALLKPKPGTLNTGADPQVLIVGAKLGALYIQKGVLKFGLWANAIIDKLRAMGVDPEAIKPHLKGIYAASQQNVSDELADQMDDYRTVRAFDLDAAGEATQDIREFIYENLAEITDNRKLKSLLAQFHGVNAADISAKQMKDAQEAVEVALVRQARATMSNKQDERAVFDQLVAQYNAQPNLNVRSSTSMENQAYSTPSPLAMIASQYAGIDIETVVYEPTAGNGMLLLGAQIDKSTVNELNDDRAANLKSLGYTVTQNDAATVDPKPEFADAVIMNPPFGRLRDDNGRVRTEKFDGYGISSIDHMIAARAMGAMKDNGRAALIIGADKVAGEISPSDRIFFNWLYSHYNVVEHFEVDGDLYSRQGAGWPVRVIIINGRVESNTKSPKSGTIVRFETWNQVYDHYNESVDSIGQQPVDGGKTGAEPDNEQDTDIDKGTSARPDGAKTDQANGPVRKPRTSTGGGAGSSGSGSAAGQQQEQSGGDRGGKQPGLLDKPSGPESAEASDSAESDTGSQPANAQQPTGGAGNKPGVAKKPSKASSSEFQTPYPVRSGGFNDAVLVPNNMAEALDNALREIESKVGMTLDEFVMQKLDYKTVEDLHHAFMGLQVDTVAAAIYNFEQKNKGIIIADQTGVGKGRQAAAIIRYAKKVGKTPIFVSVTPNLFTDMYDDLNEIGETDIHPFILNDGEEINSKFGTVKKLKPSERKQKIQNIISSGELPKGHDVFFMTYSQTTVENDQRRAVAALKHNAIFILDESHNVAGERESIKKVDGKNVTRVTGAGFMYQMIEDAPVVYLSATYAKRADNMAVYYRTDLMDAVDTADDLIAAVQGGGVPVQQVMSSMLTESGQLFRRERSFEGISIPTSIDYENSKTHRALADSVTEGLREVVNADRTFEAVFFPIYEEELQEAGGSGSMAGNKAAAGADHSNFNSVVHNYVRQMLLALKANRAADQAIAAFKRGEKPVIALESTMGSFLADFAERMGLSDGDRVIADYRDILLKALERTRRIRTKDDKGDAVVVQIEMHELDSITRQAYENAEKMIEELPLGDLPLSPIDHIRQRLSDAGIKVAEITGRTIRIDYSSGEPILSKIDPKERSNKRGTVDKFNRGDLDALILNVAGSTGLSIHASEKFTDQKPRKMIVAQPMQDINILMQMLGRVNRTGQVELPVYELLGVDLPAEKRPMALTSRKMASLNANTSANDESDTSIKAPDMLNKYGDRVINEYLKDNYDIAGMLNVPVSEGESGAMPGLAMKFTGRLALLPVKLQEEVYAEIEKAYDDEIDYLTRTGQNDLIAQTIDLDARILDSRIVYEGKAPETIFGGNTTLHRIDAKYQGKPPTAEDVGSALDKGAKLPTLDQIVAAKEADTAYERKLQQRLADNEKLLADHMKVHDATIDKDEDKRLRLAAKIDEAANHIKEYQISARQNQSLLRQFGLGQRVRLDVSDEIVVGVVVSIKDSHKAGKGNPWANSKVRVGFMVNSGIRQIELPLSKLTQDAGIYLETLRGTGKDDLERLFAPHDSNRREQRYVATGNIISGIAKLEGGRVINFTDQKGATHQGILMPRKFGRNGEYETAGGQNNIPLRDAAVIKRLLREAGSELAGAGGVFSSGQAVRITRNQGSWVVQVPKANKDAIGKSVKFDGELRALIGDFYGSGNIMTAKFTDSQLDRVVDRVLQITPLYIMPSMRDAAVKAGAPPPSNAVSSFDGEPSGATLTNKPAPRDAAGDMGEGSFRATNEKAGNVTVADLQSVVDRVGKNWGVKPVVLQSVSELPDSAKREMRRQKITGGVTGYYDRKTQTVYLVADAMKNKADAQKTLLHEAVGHLGIERVMGKDINDFLRTVYESRNSDPTIKAAWEYVNQPETYGKAPRIVKAAEMVARIAESDPKHTLVQRFIQMVRQALRKLGFTVVFNNNDIIEALRRAKRSLEDGSYAGEGSSGGLFQAAYHGSPYRHNKFTTDKIGTGEGTQAYGWGLYFAQKQDVAEYYRQLAGVNNTTGFGDYQIPDTAVDEISQLMQKADRDGDRIAAAAIDELLTGDFKPEKIRADIIEDAANDEVDPSKSLSLFDKAIEIAESYTGQLYTVDVPEDHELLDWDATVDNQPAGVKQALTQILKDIPSEAMDDYLDRKNLDWDELTGQDVYSILERAAMDDFLPETPEMFERSMPYPEIASKYLRSIGIPGLRFFDHMSRFQPPPVPQFDAWAGYYKGADLDAISDRELADLRSEYDEFVNAEDTRTRNFVIFDDDRIEITDTLFRVKGRGASNNNTPSSTASTGISYSYTTGNNQPPTGQGVPPGSSGGGVVGGGQGGAFQSPEDSMVDTVIRRWQDKMRPLLNTQTEIEKAGGTVTESNDAYRAEEAFYGKTENDLRKLREDYLEPIAGAMAREDVEREELDLYLMARHAPERNAHIASINPNMPDGGSGMTDGEAAAIMGRFAADGRIPNLEAVASLVDELLQKQRDLFRNGLQSDAVTDAWEQTYQHYVPLKGFADDEEGGGFGTGRGFDIRGKESMRALGRRSMPESPILHAIKDTTAAIIRNRKNEVGNALLQLVQDNPNPDYWEIFTDANPDTHRRIVKSAAGEEVREMPMPMGMMPDKYFATKKDGEIHYIKLKDPRLMKAMQNLGPETLGSVLQGMAVVTRFLSAMSTSYNPEFMISNASRDIQTAVLNLLAEQDLPGGKAQGKKLAGKMVKSIPIAVRAIHASLYNKPLKGAAAKWQSTFEQFREDGAKTGWFDQKEIDGQAAELERLIDIAQGGTKGNILKASKLIKDIVEHANTAIENGVRLSVYKHAIDSGVSRKKAASLAKNLTVNFNRKGEIGGVLNAMYMFANASIQGTANFMRTVGTFKKDANGKRSLNMAQKAATALVAASFGLAMLNRMMSGDDDDDENWYDKVPQHVRERNLVIMKSVFGGPEGEYYTFPLPYGYNVFYNLGDTVEAAINSDTRGMGELATGMTMAILGSFSPIGVQGSGNPGLAALKTATPTVLSPLVQLGINENFYGAPIYPENFDFGVPEPRSSLSKSSTKAHWQAVAEWMNEATGGSFYRSGAISIQPDALGHLFDFTTGSAGAFYSRLADAGKKVITGEAMDAREIPFKRRLSGQIMPYDDTNDFYKRRDEIGQIKKEMGALKGQEAKDFREEFKDKIRLIPPMTAAEKQLRNLRKARRTALEHEQTPDVKARIKRIEARMDSVVDDFNKRYKQTQS